MSDSLLSIYRRTEGDFLAVSAKTSAGLWQHIDEPPAILWAPADPAHIGREARARLAEPRPTAPHPQRDQQAETRRTSLRPIIRAAKVRSWRAFISGTALVEVERTNETFKVTPMKALPKPHGAFEPDLTHEKELTSPSAGDLGRAISEAFEVATPA